MANLLASPNELKPLYELMGDIQEMAPWEWMAETDLFGVEHPQTKEVGFVSIMGTLGEHYAVSLYLGSRGLFSFWQMQANEEDFDPELLLTTPQLMASFEDREMLETKDRQVIKTLGLKYRGRQAWPLFRSYRPGYAPYYLESEEAEFLCYALEQVLEVAPRFRTESRLQESSEEHTYLVRVAQSEDAWHDDFQTFGPPPSIPILPDVEVEQLERVRRLPQRRVRLEVDLFMLLSPVAEEGTRPFYPYVLMAVETSRGVPIGFELLSPLPSLEAMWEQVPDVFLKMLLGFGALPRKVIVKSLLLYGLLSPLPDVLGVKLAHRPVLRHLEQARLGLESFMRGR